ncbi:CD2 antigen [Cricetulus griseus]
MRCEFLAGFLLLFSISNKGTVSGDSSIIWGALGHDINLTIPNFQVTDTDEVRWEKGRTLVAQLKKEMKPFLLSEAFEILTNETLRIKKLKRDDNGTYNVIVYGANGSKRVSKPEIYWECSNTTLTCEVEKGTDLELKLYRGKKLLTSLHQKIIRYTWTNLNVPFKCSAKNKVSEESFTTTISCSVGKILTQRPPLCGLPSHDPQGKVNTKIRVLEEKSGDPFPGSLTWAFELSQEVAAPWSSSSSSEQLENKSQCPRE